MVTVDGGHPRLVHAVHGVCVPMVACRIHLNALAGCLFIRVKAFGHLPLNLKGLPPKIEQHHWFSGLEGHSAFVKHDVIHVLGPLGIGVDSVPFESCGQEAGRSPVGSMLFLL